MKHTLYKSSKETWDAMLEAIEQATKSIYLEMYIFLDDTEETHDFIGKLLKKADEGLKVVLIIDSYGSDLLKKETVNKLRESKIEFMFFSHWLRHIHRKILIIDEKISFIGGVNIGKRFEKWKDLQLMVSGRITNKILKSFAYTYAMAGGKDEKIIRYQKRKTSVKLRFWLFEHWPMRNIYVLKENYLQKISQAKKSISIVTPYFTPPRWLASLLDDAIRRGVEVTIIMPKETNHPIMNNINYGYMHDLRKIGIHFYLQKEMNHAKLLVIDSTEGLIGSQNIDLASFHLNAEAGIFFSDKKLLKEIKETIDEWLSECEPYDPKNHRMHFLDYCILGLMKILRPIL